MLYPIAIRTIDNGKCYEVEVPDLPEIKPSAETIESAVANCKRDIEVFLEMMAEDKCLPPMATTIEALFKDKKFNGMTFMLIEINIEPFMGKSKKVNITMPSLLIYKIDSFVSEHNSEYKDRSKFLQIAAMNELNRNGVI